MLPDYEADNKKVCQKRWQGCLTIDDKGIIVLYSNFLAAWIYLYDFEDTKSNKIKPKVNEDGLC